MILDEAHLLVPAVDDTPCKQVIRENVRIGRHYGICMILITQSPNTFERYQSVSGSLVDKELVCLQEWVKTSFCRLVRIEVLSLVTLILLRKLFAPVLTGCLEKAPNILRFLEFSEFYVWWGFSRFLRKTVLP
jgi:hypothetical protein